MISIFEIVNNQLTPNEILKITSKIRYDDFTDEEKYFIKSPDEVLKTRYGICYDVVELEKKLFRENNYEFKTFFVYEGLPITDNPTHTFLVFKHDNKFYWFESSWVPHRGVYGPFKSYNGAIIQVSNALKKTMGWKSVHIKEYTDFDYKGMNINQFGKYILKNS